jgi:uncharacterized protein YndB with AHSA1/START domain
MKRWKGIEATLDPRPGGVYRVTVTPRDIASGSYVAIEPYRRIVIAWGWEGDGHPVPPGSSTVEVTFEPDGDGTRLRLVHRDLPPETAGQHAEGWDHYLERLAQAAAGRDPGADPWASRAPEMPQPARGS